MIKKAAFVAMVAGFLLAGFSAWGQSSADLRLSGSIATTIMVRLKGQGSEGVNQNYQFSTPIDEYGVFAVEDTGFALEYFSNVASCDVSVTSVNPSTSNVHRLRLGASESYIPYILTVGGISFPSGAIMVSAGKASDWTFVGSNGAIAISSPIINIIGLPPGDYTDTLTFEITSN